MLRKHLSDLIEALGLEPRAPHEFDRLQWSFKDKEFDLERKSWEMERREWERERKRLNESIEREKDKNRKAKEEKDAEEEEERERGLGEVGVFWTVDDGGLDGSGLLSRINPVDLVGQLREIALGYGQLRFVRAYSSTTSGGLPPSHMESLARLEILGVELRSCLGREGTSSVTHQVILDAMLFATSSSTSQITVFLVTDNEEFVYLAAKLRMIGCNVIFVCRSMDGNKQLLRDVASGVYELDLLLPPTELSSSINTVGSAPPPSFTESQPTSIASSQSLAGGSEIPSQEEDTSVVVQQQEEVERSRTPTVVEDASGFAAGGPLTSTSFNSSAVDESSQTFGLEEDTSLVAQEDHAEDDLERSRTPTVNAFGLGSKDDVEQEQPASTDDYAEEEEPFVYQEGSSLEVEASPVESKEDEDEDAERPPYGEDAVANAVDEEAEEVIEDWEIDSPDREDEKEKSETPKVDVFGFESSTQQQQQQLVDDVITKDIITQDDTRDASANWGIETPPQPPEPTWEGQGWGVPPPPDFHAPSPKPPPTPSSWPPAASSSSPSPSYSPSTSTSQLLPPSPETSKATTTATSWASVAKSAAPLAPLPPPSNPPHHFPETHSRTPTYINTPSPVPSTSRTSSSRSSRSSFPNPNGLPLDFTPLLTVISWSLPHNKRPHQSEINDTLLRNDPDFYRKSGGGRWRSYAEAAAEAGLVEMGNDGKNGQWISLTRKGLGKVGRR